MELPQVVLDVLDTVPDLTAIPTFGQMVWNTQATLRKFPNIASVTRVGVSGQGEPIDMISIGNGSQSALFVGAPHPNELIGCLAIEYLIARLCADPALREALPYRWHFIKAIEPDAIRLNEGWFSSPGDILTYYENYYRPPLDRQAEYAFPCTEDDRLSRHPMPENLAWRRAIELAKPDFLYSLHNSEFGGAFFLVSGMPPGLATELRGLCGRYGLPLNVVGDAALNELKWEPGLYRFPNMCNHPGEIGSSDYREPGMRPIGNSSAGYSAANGTVCLFAEAPYWDCDLLLDVTPSPYSKADVEANLRDWNREALRLAERALALDYAKANVAADNMWRIILEHRNHFSNTSEVRTADAAHDEALTWSEYTIRHVGGRMERLSTIALARRLALSSLDRREGFRLASNCHDALSAQTEILAQTEGLRPVPLKRLVQFQLHAGVATMTALLAGRKP